jgi:hypothetical protein
MERFPGIRVSRHTPSKSDEEEYEETRHTNAP